MSVVSPVPLPRALFSPLIPPPNSLPPAHAAALAATKAPRIGRTGARAFPICVIAFASFIAIEANALKESEATIVLNISLTFSVTFSICIARDCWAVAASLARLSEPAN